MFGLRKARRSGSTLEALPSDKRGGAHQGGPATKPTLFAEEKIAPSAIVTISANARAMYQAEVIAADAAIAAGEAICYNNTITENNE